MPDTSSAEFEGLPLRGAVFPYARGVYPSSFTLYLPPMDGLDISSGTLTYAYAGGSVSFPGCALASAFVRRHVDGWPMMSVYGFDRRWQWAGKTVSGDYNRRLSDGTVDQNTKKTPGELATLCLQALGESGDTSKMPTSVFPPFKYSNAEARLVLQKLCDYVACEVVLNPLTNQVEIWPLGQGGTSPDTGGLLPKYRHVPRAYVPSQVMVYGGDSVWQRRLQLKCVVRPYSTSQQVLFSTTVPATGKTWDIESPLSFPDIATTDSNRPLAYEQVYREYRVTGQQDGSLNIGNVPYPINSVDQYLLNDYLLETETDLSGFKRNLPCYLDGDYYAYTDLPNNTSGTRYTGLFALDKERRIVKLPYPLFKLSSTGAYQEAALYLTTSFRVRTVEGQTVGLYRQGNVGGAGGNLSLRRPEVFSIYSTTSVPNQQTNTESQAIAELDAYVQCFQQKYANPNASEVTYPAVVPGSLDGNVAQCTWSWFINRGDETYTKVCEQEELDARGVSRNERRRRSELARLVEAAA